MSQPSSRSSTRTHDDNNDTGKNVKGWATIDRIRMSDGGNSHPRMYAAPETFKELDYRAVYLQEQEMNYCQQDPSLRLTHTHTCETHKRTNQIEIDLYWTTASTAPDISKTIFITMDYSQPLIRLIATSTSCVSFCVLYVCEWKWKPSFCLSLLYSVMTHAVWP